MFIEVNFHHMRTRVFGKLCERPDVLKHVDLLDTGTSKQNQK